ncbi:uncharacterized protein A4U43_C04F7170 [Asparagus officinalis]|uniref:Uncharacterized protein n=1 Tax=Asparagus officinalis TaxID=4686 RepID=A0A5P1EZD4_ASPOF|nr:uncharacterized protein A4U43_C04F7170 [Asparagus officinalis]
MVDSMNMVGVTKKVVASNLIKEGDVDLEVVMKVSVEKEGVGGAHDESSLSSEEEGSDVSAGLTRSGWINAARIWRQRLDEWTTAMDDRAGMGFGAGTGVTEHRTGR